MIHWIVGEELPTNQLHTVGHLYRLEMNCTGNQVPNAYHTCRYAWTLEYSSTLCLVDTPKLYDTGVAYLYGDVITVMTDALNTGQQ